jgi:hypothetical protein
LPGARRADLVRGEIFAKTLGAPRIAAMAAVTLALVGFFAFLILRVTAPQMTPLFTDLSYEKCARAVTSNTCAHKHP